MDDKLLSLKDLALKALDACGDEAALKSYHAQYLSKKGEISALMKQLKDVAPEDRPAFGKQVNAVKQEVQSAFDAKQDGLKQANLQASLSEGWLDVTMPGIPANIGHMHPISQVQYEIEAIFRGMGYDVFEGPQIEDDHHNFTALNIPEHHPARDMQDTFWLEDGNLLRTHTSSVQIRAMQSHKPPFKGIAPGRVFRYEATDASHENTFYQVEGLYIDKDVSVAHLISAMKVLLREIFKRDVKIRLRPGYFPFVEPGFELDIHCQICQGKGCSVCKHTGWVELLPCGLIHPNVLKAGGIDPDEWSGFAFGLGLNRLVMMREGIDDIRHFQSGDLRFVRQF